MAALITLVGGWVAFRLVGLFGVTGLDSWQPSLRWGLALMFLVTGVAHFAGKRRPGMIAMVPAALPRPDLLVTVTGVLELLGAAGLLVPATSTVAAGCLALLLIVMFPANVYAARHKVVLGDTQVMAVGPRTALQLGFLAACLAVVLGAH
ncbi:DoxX family membrane protein [Solihabitans fulvus]|uniref:DoxX family membrane protein n=1 Tax=Solihabitans fulvus TaxID=1892852 RepID=A0A5B2XMF5_9PSEU|nr:DoxX family membrane protein [Solihabitans fulvus]KAA2264917.1 DoxX family membrane protein [Solihabitans fulvus]